MQSLSKESITRLTAAGWSADQNRDTTPVEGVLKQHGFSVNESAKQFLQKFDRVSFSHPNYVDQHIEQVCELNAAHAASQMSREELEDYEGAIGHRLTPLGFLYNGHMFLAMGGDGRVYALDEGLMTLEGNSGTDFINALCEGRPPTEISLRQAEGETEYQIADMDLTEHAQRLLWQAGWSAERQIETGALESLLAVHGYCPGPLVVEFLRSFEDIVFEYPHCDGRANLDLCRISGRETAPNYPKSVLSDLERRMRQRLTPVGMAFQNTRILLMADDGHVYAGMREVPDTLLLLGRTPIQAINVLCEGIRPKELF